jgi:hypothetical protein
VENKLGFVETLEFIDQPEMIEFGRRAFELFSSVTDAKPMPAKIASNIFAIKPIELQMKLVSNGLPYTPARFLFVTYGVGFVPQFSLFALAFLIRTPPALAITQRIFALEKEKGSETEEYRKNMGAIIARTWAA